MVDACIQLSQLFGMVNAPPGLLQPHLSAADICDDIDRLKAVLIHSEDHETYSLLVDALTETSEILQHKRILDQKHAETLQETDATKLLETLVHFQATVAERARQFLATKCEVTDASIASALGEIVVKLIPEVSLEDQASLKTLYSQQPPHPYLNQAFYPTQEDANYLPSQFAPTDLAATQDGVLADLLHHHALPDSSETQTHVPDHPAVVTPSRSLEDHVAGVEPVVAVSLPAPRKRKATDSPADQPSAKRGKLIEADLSNLLKPFSNTSMLKLKTLKIGSFYLESSDAVQITARVYHAKKQFVWMFLDAASGKTQKMQIHFAGALLLLLHRLLLEPLLNPIPMQMLMPFSSTPWRSAPPCALSPYS